MGYWPCMMCGKPCEQPADTYCTACMLGKVQIVLSAEELRREYKALEAKLGEAEQLVKDLGTEHVSLRADIAAITARAEKAEARLADTIRALRDPYWVGLPYEPTIGAVRQVCDRAIAIAEGKQ